MRWTIVAAAAFIGLGLIAATPLAYAQAPRTPPSRVRGTIDALTDHSLTVRTPSGALMTVALAPNFVVRTVVRKHIDDIHDGDFVAATTVRGKDGNLHAIEVHIFLPAQRGVVPEGQIPWDLAPNSLMTNAIVAGIATVRGGKVLTVTYKGERTDIEVDRKTPIVTYAPGDPSMLQHDRAVFILAAKQPDGSLATTNVTVENKGVKPPM
ncbi:MAG TPA: hypothetical protein VEU53_01795 [Stellaceae bacterium]|nr:hypothetical protein [Stellaceae bacterium]